MADENSLLNWILSGAVTVLGAFATNQVRRIGKLEDDLTKHKLDMAINYVQKSEVEKRFDKIESMLIHGFDDIKEQLKGKADK